MQSALVRALLVIFILACGMLCMPVNAVMAFPLGQADLSITKSDSEDPVLIFGDFTYSILVANNGPNDATGVSVIDNLPIGVSFVNASITQGSFEHVNGSIFWNVGTMLNEALATMTIIVHVHGHGAGDTIINSAIVSSNENDPNTANNTGNEDTGIVGKLDPVTANLSINVQDFLTEDPIDEATVKVIGPESRSSLTNETGAAEFLDLLVGDYTLIVSAYGYQSETSSFTLDNNKTITVQLIQPEPRTMIETLNNDVYETSLPEATKNSLKSSLDTAIKVLEDSNAKNDVVSINSLHAFIKKVMAQYDKKIPEDVAIDLIAKAQEIIVVLSR